MKIKSAEFFVSASGLPSCPESSLPEFAFIGRSNVGKSSLINMLVGRRELAKVSGTPGKTKLMNFFVINAAWSLVDLPGYGFAKVSKENRADFSEAVADYLEHRENLACVFVLIDSRLPPQAIDVDFLQWMASRSVTHAIVFTKTDKQSNNQTHAKIAQFKRSLGEAGLKMPELFATSSESGHGRKELLAFVQQNLTEVSGG